MDKIEAKPSIVYEKKVKPSKAEVGRAVLRYKPSATIKILTGRLK